MNAAPTFAMLPLMLAVGNTQVQAAAPSAPRNIILILSDDHRYDFMDFMDQAPEWLRTPALDRMAAHGAHVQNAFVTTALCSPSRASILTGQYAHRHGVVDNSSAMPRDMVPFTHHLQKAGYGTALVGKWHIGHDEESSKPKAGFDHWVSFRGQGTYEDPVLNINGEERPFKGYTTDILTTQGLEWLEAQRRSGRPFFLMLAHKAVHAAFVPAPRHRGRYATSPIPLAETGADIESNYRGKPKWVREQRFSIHGVDHMYHGRTQFDAFYRDYTETLLGLDESVGQVLDYLDKTGLSRSTLVLYTSDNGFLLGEHGLIDKRNAYEESMRVPMLAYAPGYIAAGSKVTAMVRNIDIAPTLLEVAGVAAPSDMDGRSVLAALRGEKSLPEDELLYEYYWEYAFPHTPTTLALRGDRYKFVYYHGIWDVDELYDLETDPEERYNLIELPDQRDRVLQMRKRLFDRLEATGGMHIPLRRGDWQAGERKLHP